jgi:tight adherence protein B
MAIILGLAVGVGVILLFLGLQRIVDTRVNVVSRRIDDFVPARAAAMEKSSRRRSLFRGRGNRAQAVHWQEDDSRRARGFTERVARDLARADIKITVSEYMVISVVLASVGALLGFAMPIGGHILLGVILLAAGFYAPRIYVARQRTKRQRLFDTQLADVVMLMSGSLKAGYALLQSMELVAREAPQPVASEFDRVVREVGLGLSPEEALGNLVERMQSDDLELLVTAINVQREVGGNLVEVLDIIANTIRDRVKLLGEIRVLTAQQQYSGYIIALLPVALAMLLGVINPSYMLGLFQSTTWCGWTMMGCSAIMIVTGFIFIRQIVNIKV